MIDCQKDCVNYGTSMCAYPKFKHHVSCINFKPRNIMSEETEKRPSATFLNSIALTVNMSQGLRHVQISLFEDDETHAVKAFFDVIDPSTVKVNS